MTRRFGLNGRDPVSEFGDGAGEVRFAELISALALVSVGMMPEPRKADAVDAVLLLARCTVALACGNGSNGARPEITEETAQWGSRGASTPGTVVSPDQLAAILRHHTEEE
jgi:hypothetical protein